MLSSNTDSIKGFFQKIEPIFKIFVKIDTSDWVGLIFSIILLLVVVCTWYWVCFKSGAEKMRDGIISYNRKFGIKSENSLMTNYIFLKSIVTVVLLFSIVFLYYAVVSLISK